MAEFIGTGYQPVPGVYAPPVEEPEPEPTVAEQIEQAVLDLLTQEEADPTAIETAIEDLTLESLQAWKEALPGEKAFREKSLELMGLQVDWQTQQIKWLQDARDMGEITGDLSAGEMANLDRLEANAVQQLTTQVNRQLTDIHGAEIASLVSRGVLQGAIGSETMSKMGEMALEAIERGTTAIGSTRIGQELEMESGKRQFELQKRQLVQSGIMGTAQAQAMQSGAYGAAARPGEMALQAQQWGQELAQDWKTSRLQAGAGLWGQQMSGQQSAANRALQMSIAQMQEPTFFESISSFIPNIGFNF